LLSVRPSLACSAANSSVSRSSIASRDGRPRARFDFDGFFGGSSPKRSLKSGIGVSHPSLDLALPPHRHLVRSALLLRKPAIVDLPVNFALGETRDLNHLFQAQKSVVCQFSHGDRFLCVPIRSITFRVTLNRKHTRRDSGWTRRCKGLLPLDRETVWKKFVPRRPSEVLRRACHSRLGKAVSRAQKHLRHDHSAQNSSTPAAAS